MAKKTLKQVEETKKPVIPQFIADLIEECKRDDKSLHYFGAIDEVKCWIKKHGKIRENEDTLVRAWNDGYEVEKEKLYTIEIPNPNSDSLTVLEKLDDGTVFISQMDNFPVDWMYHNEFQLTEREYRKDFEWAWNAGIAIEANRWG